MEALIGIFASPGEYGSRLAAYINSRRDIGYGGISFQNNSELVDFLKSGELSILLTDDPKHLSAYNNIQQVFFLCEDRLRAENEGGRDEVFKYMKAGDILKRVLPGLKTEKRVKNNIITVFAPSSNETGRSAARERATKLSRQGRTLLICWDPFGFPVRREEKDLTLSELLFAFRKNRNALNDGIMSLRSENGYNVLKGTDFYTDLWQFTAEEMQEFAEMCRSAGEYEYLVFECAFMSEAVERLMTLSDEILIPEAFPGDPGPEEFMRQMKYAGKQEILSRAGAT